MGDTMKRTVPTRITALDGEFVKNIEAGGFHSLALSVKGHIYAFGNNAV
jgi:alpha-tubulin suppressor-like RCC1 family protein